MGEGNEDIEDIKLEQNHENDFLLIDRCHIVFAGLIISEKTT